MKRYFFAIVNLIIGFSIFVGLPYLAGTWKLLSISWLPAGFAFQYLEDRIDGLK